MKQPESYTEFLTRCDARAKPYLIRFALIFGFFFFLLQWIYLAAADTGAYRFYIEHLTVRPSAWVIQVFAPTDGVVAQGHRLLWPGGRLNVLLGCDGAEAIELLLAAFIAATGAWRMKLVGMAWGLVLIYALNQARLVALYFALRHDTALFELIHGMIGPLVIVALTTLFFAWWTNPRESQAA